MDCVRETDKDMLAAVAVNLKYAKSAMDDAITGADMELGPVFMAKRIKQAQMYLKAALAENKRRFI